MKKLYTLLLGVAVALTASAGANTVQLKANRAAAVNKLAGVALQAPQMSKAHAVKIEGLKLNNDILKVAEKQQGASRIDIKETWEDAGTVVFSDPWVIPSFADSPADVQQFVDELSWEVPVQKSSRGDRFKLIKPYDQPGFKALFEGTQVTCTFTDPQDLIIDCTKPNQVSIDAQCVGHYVEAEMDFYVQDLFSFFLSQGYQASVVMNAGYMPSTYKNGVITINIGVFGDAANKMGYTWQTEAKESLEANGYVKFSDAKDYSISHVAETTCPSDGYHHFTYKLGADLASAKCVVAASHYTESEEIFAAVESALGEALEDLPAKEGTFDAQTGTSDGPCTLFILGYDADGTRVAGKAVKLMNAFDGAEYWTSLGTVDYTDDLVGSFWRFTMNGETVPGTAETYKVEIQEAKSAPGLYRLVNPYVSADWKFAATNRHGCDSKHFLYIDATNPDQVTVVPSYPGYENSYGHIMVGSFNYFVEEGSEDPATYGSLKDGVITFPAESILCEYQFLYPTDASGNEDTSNGPALYYTNGNGAFKVDLNTAGINDAVIDVNDNAPVEYFNLQGVRVANPSAGELVIKRQGEKVSKTIVR